MKIPRYDGENELICRDVDVQKLESLLDEAVELLKYLDHEGYVCDWCHIPILRGINHLPDCALKLFLEKVKDK